MNYCKYLFIVQFFPEKLCIIFYVSSICNIKINHRITINDCVLLFIDTSISKTNYMYGQ